MVVEATDAEAVEDISAKINSELSHKLNLSFLYMFPPSLAKEYRDNNKIMWALKLALHNK